MGLFSSIGSIFGSGGSWLGGIADGILGMNSANKANAQKQANYNSQMQLALRQQQFNEDYAKSVMQWRVEDAKKAGVHPMAALGMNSPSLGSVSVPSDIGTYNPIDMGQSTNYAATKAKTSPEQKQMVDLQIRGMELDNEYKQAQIDQLKVDTLASSIASDQALTSPASPQVNAKSPFNGYSPDTPYGKDIYSLFTLARHGDTLVETPHPDIADSITESEWKNILAAIDAELSAETGVIKSPAYALPASEQKLYNAGIIDLVRVPGVGWKIDRNPKSGRQKHDELTGYARFKRESTKKYGRTSSGYVNSVSGKIF